MKAPFRLGFLRSPAPAIVLVMACSEPPVSPRHQIPATPAMTATVSAPGEVLLAWESQPGPSEFRLEAAAVGSPWRAIAVLTAQSQSFVHTGIPEGSTQTYRIATCSSGVCSPWSSEVTVTLPSRPLIINSEAIEVAERTAGLVARIQPGGLPTSAYFEWGASAALTPSFATSPWSTQTDSTATFRQELVSLAPGRTYYYRAVARNAIALVKGEILSFSTLLPVPATPSNLQATGGIGTVRLSWLDNSFYVQWHEVQHRASGSDTWQAARVGADTSWYVQRDLSIGSHTFRVRACNDAGCSSWSNEVTAYVLGPPLATTGPATGIEAAMALLGAEVTPNGLATGVRFELSPDPSFAGADTTPAFSVPPGWTAVSVMSWATGLSPNTTYYYRVLAGNEAGNVRGVPLSFTTHALTVAVPAAPSDAHVTGAIGQATVRWSDNSSNEEQFELHFRSAGMTDWRTVGVSPPANSTSFVHTQLPPGRYAYRVRACNLAGCSAWSGEADSFVMGAPTAIMDSVSAITSTSATLNGHVNPNGLTTTVRFEISEEPTFRNALNMLVGGLPAGNVPVPVRAAPAGLLPSTTYYFRLVSFNNAGETRPTAATFETLPAPGFPPAVTTGPVYEISDQPTVWVYVNPNGAPTTAWLEYSTDPTLATLDSSRHPQTNVVDSTLVRFPATARTQYYYRAVARNAFGTVRGGIRTTFTDRPSVPAADFSAQLLPDYRVILRWNPADVLAENRGRPSWYGRMREPGTAIWYAIGFVPIGDSTAVLLPPVNNDSLEFALCVRNAVGGGPCTSTVTLRGLLLPAPEGLRVMSATLAGVSLAWEDMSSTESGFTVIRSWTDSLGVYHNVIIATLPANTTSFTHTMDLQVGVEYTYGVTAITAQRQASRLVTVKATIAP